MSWKPSSVANPPNKMRTLILIPTETEAALLRAAWSRCAGPHRGSRHGGRSRSDGPDHRGGTPRPADPGRHRRSFRPFGSRMRSRRGRRGANRRTAPGNTPSAMRPTSFRQDCGPSKAIRPIARESQRPARKLKIWKEPLSWPSAGHSECPAPRCGPCRTIPTTRVRPGASRKVQKN